MIQYSTERTLLYLPDVVPVGELAVSLEPGPAVDHDPGHRTREAPGAAPLCLALHSPNDLRKKHRTMLGDIFVCALLSVRARGGVCAACLPQRRTMVWDDSCLCVRVCVFSAAGKGDVCM